MPTVCCGPLEGLLRLATVIHSLRSSIFIKKKKIVFSIGSILKHDTLKQHVKVQTGSQNEVQVSAPIASCNILPLHK